MTQIPLPELFLFAWELDSMDEYSTSLPSGTTIGKMWRCNINRKAERGWIGMPDHNNPQWLVCMYAEHEDPTKVAILRFTVTVRQGPAPRVYRAPDWSYFAGWKRQREAELAGA